MKAPHRIAVIQENWPAIPGHGGEVRVYQVRVIYDTTNFVYGKRHWYSRKKFYPKVGMFVKVTEIMEYK